MVKSSVTVLHNVKLAGRGGVTLTTGRLTLSSPEIHELIGIGDREPRRRVVTSSVTVSL